MNITKERVAYFSMEIGLDTKIPTYSGGLGVLAGDTIKSAADVGLPMVAVTLLYNKGYFTQSIDESGKQSESPASWQPADSLEKVDVSCQVEVEGRIVKFSAWRADCKGARGHTVPVYFIDASDPSNSEFDRSLTDQLYGGDERYRLAQETILGMGGISLLQALGHKELETFHMNEGHAALLTVALLRQRLREAGKGLASASKEDLESVRQRCVFTTHTPVPAGHDKFPEDLAKKVLGDEVFGCLQATEVIQDRELNMTKLALRFSRYVNGVAKRHGEVSRKMFPEATIEAITNGVHAQTWVCEEFANLFDRYIPDWRVDNHYLRYACEIPLREIKDAHVGAKKQLLQTIQDRCGKVFDPDVLTIGFARRAATYKRGDLLFVDPEMLKQIAAKHGSIQVVFAGKAHPRDEGGKELIRRIHERMNEAFAEGPVKAVYLENYDMELGKMITSGVDVWLNNPMKPLEASGTSGMKSALNGVPSLSVLDGWWVEGCIEGVTGWEIADDVDALAEPPKNEAERTDAARSMYSQLEHRIVPLYYNNNLEFLRVRRNSIVLNGSYFNCQRMIEQYRDNAYRL